MRKGGERRGLGRANINFGDTDFWKMRIIFQEINEEMRSTMISGEVPRHEGGLSTGFCERHSSPNEAHNVGRFVQEYTGSHARRQYARYKT
jgi:hypothetical protein